MDWAHDNARLDPAVATNVFRYASQPSVVVKMVKSNKYEIQIWCLQTYDDWTAWMQQHVSDDSQDDGLVLILARRAGEQPACVPSKCPVTPSEWAESQKDFAVRVALRRADTIAAFGEKNSPGRPARQIAPVIVQQSIRIVPFSSATFQKICERFSVHESIVRAISRSDIPVFTCESVDMGKPAYVYNCRTSNSWDLDLALSATYFPTSGLTLAVVYGCAVTTETSILRRLASVQGTALHPLLLPGILAEVELARHARIVEKSINEVEAKIFELDSQASVNERLERAEIESRNEAKRSAWLDLTYLRNSLKTWNAQLRTMADHADELERHVFRPYSRSAKQACEAWDLTGLSVRRSRSSSNTTSRSSTPLTVAVHERFHGSTVRSSSKCGMKIKRRLDTIQIEYDEKIRDCTMRIDGMAMATQWAHSETAVEMATATNKESNVMKSISLVTMIFLPGTFFATVFSMTFFDWKGDGSERVSSYLWIYVVVTVVFTMITIGLWYYFVIYKRRPQKVCNEKC
ncbi:hypothetical protein C7974DRAFT_202158 [Boeremia exigua]|uniref:uncharacterized protein n=1 Tax=Boeremia exigua TaxID=749465 RepID=UPI001E8E6AA9|nr:uncharacterized protein C7974DRAFT_202158 [Boeremia exigua]KAH6625485.1 hypothetical protein C7974DRAFT_202158 [Boeremia exigua]